MVVLFIIGGLGVLLFTYKDSEPTQTSNPASSGPDQKQDGAKRESRKKAQSETKSEASSITFSMYKDIYRDYNVIHRIRENNNVNKKNAAVEFVFLWRNEEGSLDAFPINGYRFRQYDESNPGEDRISYHHSEKQTIRSMITVGGDGRFQSGFNPNVQPGSTYLLTTIFKEGESERLDATGYEDFWYQIHIPEKEKLHYTNNFEELKKNAQRIPILVNEVIKTDYREGLKKKLGMEETSSETRPVTITGVKEIPAEGWTTNVQYLYDGMEKIVSDRNKNGSWKLDVEVKKQKEEIKHSGSVAVYRRLVEDYYEDQKGVKLKGLLQMGAKEIYPRILLKYRKNVRGKNINMNKDLDFHHDQTKWIERTINVGELIRERFEKRFDKKLKPPTNRKFSNASVTLSIPDPNQANLERKEKKIKKIKPVIKICSRLPYWENGKLKATLKAPEGRYNLIFNQQFLVKNYDWPPEKK